MVLRCFWSNTTPTLTEIQRLPLDHYRADSSFDTHGLVGFTYLPNGSIVFTSASGFLWRLDPAPQRPATLTELGWFHPEGASYPAVPVRPRRHTICVGRRWSRT